MGNWERWSRWVVLLVLLTNVALLGIVALFLGEFGTEMRSLRDAVTGARPPQMARVTDAHHALRGPCTRCHSEERFTRLHGSKDDLARIIDRMKANPKAQISDAEADTIHAALMLLKCEKCHTGEMVEKLSLMKPDYRLSVIREMAKKPGSGIQVEESKDILNAWERLLGF